MVGDSHKATVTAFINTDPVADGTLKNATTYFRRFLVVPDPSQFVAIRLTLTIRSGPPFPTLSPFRRRLLDCGGSPPLWGTG